MVVEIRSRARVLRSRSGTAADGSRLAAGWGRRPGSRPAEASGSRHRRPAAASQESEAAGRSEGPPGIGGCEPVGYPPRTGAVRRSPTTETLAGMAPEGGPPALGRIIGSPPPAIGAMIAGLPSRSKRVVSASRRRLLGLLLGLGALGRTFGIHQVANLGEQETSVSSSAFSPVKRSASLL